MANPLTRKQVIEMITDSLYYGCGISDKKEINDALRWWRKSPIADIRGEAETCFGWTEYRPWTFKTIEENK